MSVNVEKLTAELRAACPRVVGCSTAGGGRVDFADGTSWRPGEPTGDADRVAVAAVVAAHSPAATADQRLRARGYTRLMAALVLIARYGRANAPDWARDLIDAAAAEIEGA